MTLRRGADLVATPWRNGLGVTRDVATGLDADGALLWQVSIAELTGDCDFSDYAGFDRVFTPVAGDAITLSHDGGPFLPCPLLLPHPFPGEARTRCRLGGPGRAFNVITAQGRRAADVQVLRLAAGMPVPRATVLHCWAGTLDTPDGLAGPGDNLLNSMADTAGDAVLIVVQISPA